MTFISPSPPIRSTEATSQNFTSKTDQLFDFIQKAYAPGGQSDGRDDEQLRAIRTKMKLEGEDKKVREGR